MANKSILIRSIDEIPQYLKSIKDTTNKAIINIGELLSSTDDNMKVLSKFKFDQLGYEPLQGYELNFIEQINQAFSDIVVLKAIEIILVTDPNHEFILNPGTKDGHDIISIDNRIIGECFATTNLTNNKKIKKDIAKLKNNLLADKKYIVFYAKEVNETTLSNLINNNPEITFIRLSNISI